jgi:hypothetical protein
MIATFDAAKMNIPMVHGHSPKHWRTFIDAMMLKNEGMPLVEKLLSNILLIEVFNYINEHIG